jgi:hypothetical protein
MRFWIGGPRIGPRFFRLRPGVSSEDFRHAQLRAHPLWPYLLVTAVAIGAGWLMGDPVPAFFGWLGLMVIAWLVSRAI